MRGVLHYNPNERDAKRQVQLTLGAMSQFLPFKGLPPEIKAALQKLPHKVSVEVKGEPPNHTYHLMNERHDTSSSNAFGSPPRHSDAGYTIVATRGSILNPTPKKKPAYQITDPGLGFSLGNRLADPEQGLHPGLKLVQFGPDVPEVGGQAPNIARNPYNFVAFVGDEPWLEKEPHPDHASWKEGCHSGVLEFEASALSPIFIPEGFPFKQADGDLELPRHFFRLPNAEGQMRYAIPGSSLKGVLRSMVEALSNSRCGELNEESYSLPIPYRRRVFKNMGILSRQNGECGVTRVKLLYVDNHRHWNGKFKPPESNETLAYTEKTGSSPVEVDRALSRATFVTGNRPAWIASEPGCPQIIDLCSERRRCLGRVAAKRTLDIAEHRV